MTKETSQATREVPGWPVIIDLRADPYEKAPHESGLYLRWYADNIWLFVPVQEKLKAFLTTLPEYPVPAGQQPERRGHQLQLPSSDAGHETPEGIGELLVAAQLIRNGTFTQERYDESKIFYGRRP